MRPTLFCLSLCLLWLGGLAPTSYAQATEPTAAPRTLYLVRHGHYDAVTGADSKTANALNPLGREQAALIATRLAALPVKFTTVTSSEFTRARETGDIIATRLGLSCARNGNLNECTPPGVRLKAAELDSGAEAQLEKAWAEFFRPSPTGPVHEVLACHGNVIRWLVCRALGVDPHQWTNMEIANGSLTIILIRADGSMRLEVYNDVSHVPLDRQTWSGRGPGWPLPAQPHKK